MSGDIGCPIPANPTPEQREFLTGMKRRRVTMATVLFPPGEGAPTFADVPLTMLGLPGFGPKVAWVPHPGGQWPERPGMARLHYEWVLPESPAVRFITDINTDATKLLNQPGTIHGKGSRPLQPGESIMARAWLVFDAGVMCPYFTLRGEHHDEVMKIIHLDFECDYSVIGVESKHDDKLYVFPSHSCGTEAVQYMHEMVADTSVPDEDKPTPAEIATAASEYQNFPMYARMRWG